jgi:hypothetical protein
MLRCLYFNLIVAIVITLILHIKAEQIPIAADIDNSWQPALHNIRADTSEPLFCFVVRTYWGHGDAHGGGLRRFLHSLQRQQHQRWEAVILVADSKPFPDIHHILLDLNDTRSWVFAEWVRNEANNKNLPQLLLNFFSLDNKLYSLINSLIINYRLDLNSLLNSQTELGLLIITVFYTISRMTPFKFAHLKLNG